MKDYTKDAGVPLPVAGLLNDIQSAVFAGGLPVCHACNVIWEPAWTYCRSCRGEVSSFVRLIKSEAKET